MTSGATSFATRLAEVGADVEAELEALLTLAPRPGERARPERLMNAMRHGALGGGKRLRPFLTIETARALGCSTGTVKSTASKALAHLREVFLPTSQPEVCEP